MKLSELKPNPKNPRDIDEKELEMLKKSLDKFGDLSGFVVNKVTGNIVSGNQRKKVLPSDSEIVITEQYEKPNAKGTIAIGYVVVDGEKHKYREVLFDEATEKAANIAANQQGGNFNLPALKEWVMELDELSIDLDLLGFKDDFLQTLIAPIHQAHGDEDAVPETPKEAKTKLGDIYKLGNHRLMCGDSTMIDNVEKLMDGSKADMVFTDPPYGISYNAQRSNLPNSTKHKDIIGDNEPPELGTVFLFDCIKLIWGANNFTKLLPFNGLWACWDKRSDNSNGITADGMIGSDFELAWISKTSGYYKIFRVMHGGVVNKDGGKRVHPTQKPTKLISDCFEHYAKDSINIVDLFGGSGSTLIACEKTNRKCFMMELDPHYVDVIIKRFIQYANKPVFRINDDGIETDITAEFFI